MSGFLTRRILQVIPTLLIVSIIVFFVTRMLPGNPAAVMLGPQANAEDIARLTAELGLDKSIPVQFLQFLKDLVTFNFGESLTYHEPVISLILERFPNTMILAMSALILAVVIGVPLGIFAAYKQN